MKNFYDKETSNIITDILNVDKNLTKEQISDELFAFLVTSTKNEN